jgi:hypothetical protein
VLPLDDQWWYAAQDCTPSGFACYFQPLSSCTEADSLDVVSFLLPAQQVSENEQASERDRDREREREREEEERTSQPAREREREREREGGRERERERRGGMC